MTQPSVRPLTGGEMPRRPCQRVAGRVDPDVLIMSGSQVPREAHAKAKERHDFAMSRRGGRQR
jgi:hypothetical protein